MCCPQCQGDIDDLSSEKLKTLTSVNTPRIHTNPQIKNASRAVKIIPSEEQSDPPKHNYLTSTQSSGFRCSTWILLRIP